MSSNQHLGNLALRAAIYSDTLSMSKRAAGLVPSLIAHGGKGLELFRKGVNATKAAPGKAWSAAKAAPGNAWSATNAAPGKAWTAAKAAPGALAAGAWQATKAAPGYMGRQALNAGKWFIPTTPGSAAFWPGLGLASYYAPKAWDAATQPGRDMARADTALELINKMSELSTGQRFGYAIDPQTARYRMLAQLAEEYPQALDYYHNSGQLSPQEIQQILNQL